MQTRRALKNFSKGEIDYDTVTSGGPLAQNAEWLLKMHEKRTAEIEVSKRRHEFAAAQPVLQAARTKLDEMMGSSVLTDDTPIVTRFDAYTAVRDAAKVKNSDLGLKRLAIHFERLWHQEPLGTLSAGVVSRLRDHYQYESPRSVVGEVIDTVIPKVSFNNLPVAKLARIAVEIETQEDYDGAIMRHGLHGDNLSCIRARAFVRELVNRRLALHDKECAGDKTCAGDACATHGKKAAIGTATRKDKDVAVRIANRIFKDAQIEPREPKELEETDSDIKAEGDSQKSKDNMGIEGSGMLQVASKYLDDMPDDEFLKIALVSQEAMYNWAAASGEGMPKVAQDLKAVAPPGWESTVKKMKKHEDKIDNPWALANWMKGEGYEPKKGEVQADSKLESWKGIDKTAEAAKDTKGQAEFKPKVNPQQEDQVKVPEDGSKAIKAFAIPANHPLVDDSCDHLPMDTDLRKKQAQSYVKQLLENPVNVPAWWLGSIEELAEVVNFALQNKNAAGLPPQLEKFKKTKKDDKKESPAKKDSKGGMPEDVKERFKSKGGKFDKEQIEQLLVDGFGSIKMAGYELSVSDDNKVCIKTKTGTKQYSLVDMDSAMDDFIYLVHTAKHPAGDPPAALFHIREGIRFTCPGCSEVNSYLMPKEASDLSCGSCHTIIPAKVVSAALDIGAAQEETALVIFTPVQLQDALGEVFGKAAQLMGTEEVVVDGCRAEAYGINTSNEKLAEVWDLMIGAGFKPLAQMAPPASPGGAAMPPPPPASGMTAQGPEDMPPPPMPGMEGLEGMPGMEGMDPLGEPGPNLGEPVDGPKWEDHQLIQAGMMHYQHQGMSPVEAIAQFSKDYGDGHDPQTVIQMAATVYGIDLGEIKISGPADAMPELEPGPELPPELPPVEARSKKADLPSTKVNQQQPDAVAAPSDLGSDSDNEDPKNYGAGAIEQQHPAQEQRGTSEPSPKMGPDSDNKDPGYFKSEHPKSQHPATDQAGTSLPGTDLGPDSDNQMGRMMNKMETESAAADNNPRSK